MKDCYFKLSDRLINGFIKELDKIYKMITLSTMDIPEIEWERGELIDNHDGCREYACAGTSKDGVEWIGTWFQTGDEVDIENIEKA